MGPGGLHSIGQQPLAYALNEFKQARRQAVLEMMTSRLLGRSVDLLSFNEIASMLKVQGRSERGIQDIPIAAIVGSVGRYNDFTRSFLPRQDWDADRWAHVKTAGHVADLPPIDVYKIGETYFVLDGNHRVSIARQLRIEFIQASVTEVYTRVPIDPSIQPDELIIKAEYAAFLERTRLDRLRPFANLHVTVPGRYEQLENHIEVHRFFIEMAEDIELSDDKAVERWFDEAYLPLVQAMREQNVLDEFPGRTETDLYIWLATHAAKLRNALGWEVRPGTAVAQFSKQLKQKGVVSRAFASVLHVVVPNGWQGESLKDWAEERMIDRYSHNLFAEIMVPIGDEMECVLQQAVVIAQKENGRIVGLFTGEISEEGSKKEADFREMCGAAQVTAAWVHESGSLAEIIKRRARLADLVILTDKQLTSDLQLHTARPLLVVSSQVSSLHKTLLINKKADDPSLFVAAYLAEMWHTELVALATNQQAATAEYLDFHGVMAQFVDTKEAWKTAVAQQCDLIICGRNDRMLELLRQRFQIPLLIC